MKTEMTLSGLDGVYDMLRKLPPEVVSKRGGVVRVALRKGAMVLVKQAKVNFVAAVAQVGKSGITDTTGFTEKQIAAIRRPPPPDEKGERYVVTVRYVLHPSGHKFRKGLIRANDIAFLMEHGSAKQPATPWLLPAFVAKAPDAIRTVETETIKGTNQAVKKLTGGKGLV